MSRLDELFKVLVDGWNFGGCCLKDCQGLFNKAMISLKLSGISYEFFAVK